MSSPFAARHDLPLHLTCQRVLVVDSDLKWIERVREGLRDYGFEVVGFRNGSQLIEYMARKLVAQREHEDEPAAVVLDASMRGLHALAVVRSLHHAFPHVPIVVVATDDIERTRNLACDNGALACVVKPQNVSDLALVIHTSLRSQSVH